MLQSGTINTPAIAALGASLDYIKKVTPEAIAEKQTELAYLLIEKLLNVIKNPYDYSNINEEYSKTPKPTSCAYKTYCGT